MRLSFTVLLSILLSTGFSFSQKAKITDKVISYKFQCYPDVGGYEDYKTYNLDFVNRYGENYGYSTGNTKEAMEKELNILFGFLTDFTYNKLNTDLFIKIKQINHTNEKKEVVKYDDFSNPNAKVQRFVYKIAAEETYKVELLDARNGNKLIKELTIEAKPTIHWPSEPLGNKGYTSEALLTSNYAKRQESEQGFIKKIDVEFAKNSLYSIKKPIEHTLKTQVIKYDYWVSGVKTKETDQFLQLDSAEVYLKLAVDAMNENNKNGIKGNHHRANVRDIVTKVHNIYLKYNKDEYVNWFTDVELKEEYKMYMASNLYFTAVLMDDYALSEKLYASMKPQDVGSAPLIPTLKRSVKEKAFQDRMNQIRNIELREQQFEADFKKRYDY
jgi:hypothetical protein